MLEDGTLTVAETEVVAGVLMLEMEVVTGGLKLEAEVVAGVLVCF